MIDAGQPFAIVEIPKGPAGIEATLSIMKLVARRQAPLPNVRTAAISITKDAGPYDGAGRAASILEWVRGHMSFVPDPIGTEALTTPEAHIRSVVVNGSTSGDCDDAATLIATLARSVGLHTRFVAASFLPSGRLHHVWAEAFDGKWLPLDPFRSERFGGAETNRRIVPV